MDGINKTLYIPLYGKAVVSKKGIILHDPTAEQIWRAEAFPIKGKSKSKWLAYNMAMRARVFDDWARRMMEEHQEAMVLQIGCGLDSRCRRINASQRYWIDCDFPKVIAARKKYYAQSDYYTMRGLDATNRNDLSSLPQSPCAIVILEGLSMYLSNEQLKNMLWILREKYPQLHILMDAYTQLGASASKYKNPVHEVGVTRLYGVDHIQQLLDPAGLCFVKEHSFTPDALVNELKGFEKHFFKLMFTGRLYQKVYRLFEFQSHDALWAPSHLPDCRQADLYEHNEPAECSLFPP